MWSMVSAGILVGCSLSVKNIIAMGKRDKRENTMKTIEKQINKWVYFHFINS